MRHIVLEIADGITQYPATDLDQSKYRKSFRDANNALVVEYHGVASEADLPTWDSNIGVPPEPVEYETTMQSSEFVNQFTGPEADLFNESTDPVMVKIRNRFILRDRIVDVEDAETIGFMAAAVTAGVLTQDRADELSLGKPI